VEEVAGRGGRARVRATGGGRVRRLAATRREAVATQIEGNAGD